ncbi:MAG: MlaD family protein [Muribaculaceae bacterium]|nr:MlaD family protein [Muribaculaceae bacterium]
MKKKFNKEFIIGLSVIIAIVILFFGIDYLKGINLFQPTNYYTIEYKDVAGLEKSAPVTINGFKVGQVRDISIDYSHPDKIKVTLALNKDLRLPEDSRAELASTLLSGAYVNIRLGSSDKMMAVGSEIQPMVSADLMTALQQDVMPAVSNILPKIDSLMYHLNQLAGDPALQQSIQRLDGITNNIMLTTSSLNSQISGQLPGIMSGARTAMVQLDTITGNLAILSRDLKTLPLQPTVDNLQRVTANLDQFSRQLNNQNSTLGKLTNDPALYNQLNTVAADIDSLIVDIKRNPKRYISIKLL